MAQPAGEQDVAALANRIADVHRALPVVVVTCPSNAAGPRVSVPELERAVGARAHVALVAAPTCIQRLSDALRARGLPTVYGGAVRVFAPHHGALRRGTDSHPLVTLYDDDDPDALRQIAGAVDRAGRCPPETVRSAAAEGASPRPLRAVPLPGPARPAETPGASSAHSPGRPGAGQQPLAAAPAPASDSDSASARPAEPAAPVVQVVRVQVPFPESAAALARLSEVVADQNADIRRLRAQARELRCLLDSETARSAELRHELEHRRAHPPAASGSKKRRTDSTLEPGRTVVYGDPVRQLEHEITLLWLETVTEDEREQWPLRGYRPGPDFLASIESRVAARGKVLEVAVQVITRRAASVPAREVRQFRQGLRGPQRTRADGALAWRANLAAKTPQAPRFLWWELPDGSVELGRAAAHDDLQLR